MMYSLPEQDVVEYPQDIVRRLSDFQAAKFPLRSLFGGRVDGEWVVDVRLLMEYDMRHRASCLCESFAASIVKRVHGPQTRLGSGLAVVSIAVFILHIEFLYRTYKS